MSNSLHWNFFLLCFDSCAVFRRLSANCQLLCNCFPLKHVLVQCDVMSCIFSWLSGGIILFLLDSMLFSLFRKIRAADQRSTFLSGYPLKIRKCDAHFVLQYSAIFSLHSFIAISINFAHMFTRARAHIRINETSLFCSDFAQEYEAKM